MIGAWRGVPGLLFSCFLFGMGFLLSPQALAHRGPTQVLDELDLAIEAAPTDVEALLDRAGLQLRVGDVVGAMRDLEVVEKARPGSPDALLLRGLARADSGDPLLAEADLSEFLERVANHHGALASRARLREADGRLVLAWQDYDAASRLSSDPDVVLARGRVALGMGNRVLACDGYRGGLARLGGAVVLEMAMESAGCGPAQRFENTPGAPDQRREDVWVPPPMPGALERWPYLQSTHPEGTTLVWRTEDVSAGSVLYGTSPTALSTEVASNSIGPQHEVVISGLMPDTRYYYGVKVDGVVAAGGDEDHTFLTAPITGQEKKTRIWVVGDSGTGATRQLEVRDAMLDFVGSDLPELYLHVGDMAYNDGTDSEFTDKFYAPYRDQLRRMTTWPAMGNHEGRSSTSATQSGPYYEGYVLPTAAEAGGLASGTEAYYSFDYGTLHVIVLDSHESSRVPGDAMLTWLEADLAATNQEWVIASWHHPPYTKGTHDSDTESRHIEMRENVLPILEAAGVDLVLGGHSHIYERSFLVDGATETPSTSTGILDSGDGRLSGSGAYQKPAASGPNQGAVYVVAGHGAKSTGGPGNHPLMAFTEYENGSVILDLHQNRLQVTNIRYDGVVTDDVALVKGDALVLTTPDGGRLEPGDIHTVAWETVGDIPTVDVAWTCDDGANWIEIADGVANTGSVDWAVPLIEANHGLVRVVSSTDENTWDESNAGIQIGVEPVEEEVISTGDTWSYHDQDVDPGVGWQESTFDDSTWSSGPGQLGYGDGDEATLLNDADPNVPSVYFRRVVDITGTVSAATLTALYDDGIAVWVNGVVVVGVNVDDGTDHATWASSQSSDNSTVEQVLDLSANPFVEGQNVVAAMVKQVSGTSSDVSFDMALTLTIETNIELESCPVPVPEDTGNDSGNDSGQDSENDSDSHSGGPEDSGGPNDTAVPEKVGCGCGSRPGDSSLPLWLLIGSMVGLIRRTRS